MKTKKQTIGKKCLAGLLCLAMAGTSAVILPRSTQHAEMLAPDEGETRIRVDIGRNENRALMLTDGWYNWKLATESSTASTTETVQDLSFQITCISDGALNASSYKGMEGKGTDGTTPSLTIDGITLKDETVAGSGILDLMISGLSDGTHSIKTYHSYWDAVSPESLLAETTLVISTKGVTPVTAAAVSRVTDDDDASTAYLSFEVENGEEVHITIQSTGSLPAVLNAFEIDGVNVSKAISKAAPLDGQTDVATGGAISFQGAEGATEHDLYLGTDKTEVTNADTASPCFQGTLTTSSFSYKLLPETDYYWRVDEHFSDGTIEKGTVYHFTTIREEYLAFPSAEGYGRFARGGRGGEVLFVTNLNDSGEGSLRDAIENHTGPRTIIFRVGGVIELESKLVIDQSHGNVYIAGQTAPGDGITLTKYSLGMLGANDVIIRDIRMRIGDASGTESDGMGMSSSNNCIIDHCSISWATDEGFSSRSAKNITFQWNIIGESLHDSIHYGSNHTGTETHAFAASISGNKGSFHHNLLIDCTGRNCHLPAVWNQMA